MWLFIMGFCQYSEAQNNLLRNLFKFEKIFIKTNIVDMGKTNCFDLQIDKTDLRPFKMACNIYIHTLRKHLNWMGLHSHKKR